MANYTIGITLEATDNATSDIQKAETSLLDLEQSQADFTTTANQTTDAAAKQKSAFGELTSTVSNMLVAYAGIKGLQLVGEMIDQGNAVNIANQTFVNLTGGVEQARDALASMRTATGNVVTDFDLMNGANRLLLMNLAQTGDEAASLTRIAVTLGRAMGQDAKDSIESFAALLANQSIPRLDNFGISSDRVRARLEELKAAGMGAQEAFSMAVMEQGTAALTRLGNATTAAITPVDQFKTAWGNFWDTFDSRVSQAVNGLIGLAQYATGTTPQQQQRQSHALDNTAPIYQSVIQGFTGGANSDFVMQFVQQALQDTANNPALINDAKALGAQVQKELAASIPFAEDWQGFENMLVGPFKGMDISDVFVQMAANIAQVNNGIEYTQNVTTKARAAWAGLADDMRAGSQTKPIEGAFGMFGGGADRSGYLSQAAARDDLISSLTQRSARQHAVDYWDTYTQFWSEKQEQAAEQQQQAERQAALDAWQTKAQALQEAQAQLADFNVMGAGIGDYAFQEQADAVKAKFEEIKALGDQGLLSQDDVNKASELADQAQRAADNMKNIRLPDVFGQGSGGLMGQITDDVIKQMQASGQYKPEEIQAYQQQLDLASGRETSASVAYQQDVLPLLGDIGKLSPEDMKKAVQNLTTVMQLAAQQNLTPDQIAAILPQATGYGYTGASAQQFTVKPGQTLSDIAAQTGIPVDQLLASTQARNANLVMPGTYGMGGAVQPLPGFDPAMLLQGKPGEAGAEDTGRGWSVLQTSLSDMIPDSQSLSDNFGTIKTNTDSIVSSVYQLGTDLENLARGTHTIDVELNIKNLNDLYSMFKVPTGGGGSTTKTRDNGGQVKGTDNRTAE